MTGVMVKSTGAARRAGNIKVEQDFHVKTFAEKIPTAGAVVFTEPLLDFIPKLSPFLNDQFGAAMNQDVSFGGTPELIFNGGSGGTEWTGSAISGTWNFADAGKVTITAASDGDAALFEDAGTIDMSNFTAVTGKVDLDTYDPTRNTILVQFGLAGGLLGNNVNLNDFIDTGNFLEQNFVLTKSDLGLTSDIVDEMTLTITRTGGPAPTIKFDDFQIEETGDPLVFKTSAGVGNRYRVSHIRMMIIDNIASTLASSTMPNFSYNTLLGVSALANGIVLQGVHGGVVDFSLTFKQLSDFIFVGFDIVDNFSDGTNTVLTLELALEQPIVLEGGSDNDFLSLTVNDDLSDLVQLGALTRGSLDA